MPMTCASCACRSTSLAFFTERDGIRSSLCETMASFAYRSSIAGLKISTRCRAICARRRRRISSSVLPLYMLPTITSIEPVPGKLRVGSFMGRATLRGRCGGVNCGWNWAGPARPVPSPLPLSTHEAGSERAFGGVLIVRTAQQPDSGQGAAAAARHRVHVVELQ